MLLPGHKAVITKIKMDNEMVITGAKNGELKIMNFNMFKTDIHKAPSCITIKS